MCIRRQQRTDKHTRLCFMLVTTEWQTKREDLVCNKKAVDQVVRRTWVTRVNIKISLSDSTHDNIQYTLCVTIDTDADITQSKMSIYYFVSSKQFLFTMCLQLKSKWMQCLKKKKAKQHSLAYIFFHNIQIIAVYTGSISYNMYSKYRYTIQSQVYS